MKAKARFSRSAAPRRFSGDVRGSAASSHRPATFLALPVALLAALAALLATAVAPASAAAPEHPFLETFGSANQPTFSDPNGIAVAESSGDVYVADNGVSA